MVTRPRPAAVRTARALYALGREPFIEPMIEIETLPAALPDLAEFQALAFTSANGVQAFRDLSADRSLPAYAVGPATAEAAREAGFADVRECGGTVDHLNNILAADGPGSVLYLSGEHVAGTAGAPGVPVERLPIYRAVAAEGFSPEGRALLAGGGIESALFFSARTAAVFAGLARREGLEKALSGTRALCIADSVVESLRGLPWRRVQAAATPDQAGLLALLEEGGTLKNIGTDTGQS